MVKIHILVTCTPGREGDAILELEWALENVKVHGTQWRGVLIAETSLSKKEALERIKTFETQAIQRFIPFEAFTELNELEDKVLEVLDRISISGSFAVRAKVRGSSISSREIEINLGRRILERFPNLRVDLSNPDWIVAIEVLGNRVGILVLSSRDVLRFETSP